MPKTLPQRIAVFLLAAVVGHFAVRLVFGKSEYLPPATIHRPWTASRVGMNGFQLDAPWKLESLSLPFPAWLAGKLRDPAVHYGHIEDAGGVMASRFPIARGVPADLDGAATGMVEEMRKVPGTLRIDSRRRETVLLGERAIEVTSRIQREKGKPLRAVGIVALVNGDLLQVSVMTLDDEPLASELCNRVLASVRPG
jgi:hypothetical protein